MSYAKVTEFLVVAEEIRQALEAGNPIVALESTVITHGLLPQNLT
jgi:pseudouridine-5'-phosphate glycosidase